MRLPPPPSSPNTYRKRTPSEEAAAHVRTRAATPRQKYPASGGWMVSRATDEEIAGISQSTRLPIIRGKNNFRSDVCYSSLLRGRKRVLLETWVRTEAGSWLRINVAGVLS